MKNISTLLNKYMLWGKQIGDGTDEILAFISESLLVYTNRESPKLSSLISDHNMR